MRTIAQIITHAQSKYYELKPRANEAMRKRRKSARRAIELTLRATIFERDRALCAYCGKIGSEIDHIVPVCCGGINAYDNLVVVCRQCNGKKLGKRLSLEQEAAVKAKIK